LLLTASISGEYFCDMPRSGDEADIQRLYALPMPGAISLSLQVEPNYQHAASIQGDRHDMVVVRRRSDEQVVAIGSRSVRELWINGELRRVGYLSGLRNMPGVRLPRRLIAQTFDQLLSMRRPDEVDYDLTSIMADNVTARRALERGVKGLPRYSPVGEIVTLTVPTGPKRGLLPPFRRLENADMPRVAALLRSDGCASHARPNWTLDALLCPDRGRGLRPESFIGCEHAGQLVACGAVWDQRAFKQTIVSALSPALARWRHWINAGCRFAGRVHLPRPNEMLPMVYASHLVFPHDRPGLLEQLLSGLRSLAAEMGAEAMVFGLPATHPAASHWMLKRQAWRARSVIYVVHHSVPPTLDDRPVWPEVAVL